MFRFEHDAQALADIAKALYAIGHVKQVKLTRDMPGDDRYMLFVDFEPGHEAGPMPDRETPLELTLRYLGYAGTADEFRDSISNEESRSLLRMGGVTIWPTPSADRDGEYIFDPEEGAFVPPLVIEDTEPPRVRVVGNIASIGPFEVDRSQIGWYQA